MTRIVVTRTILGAAIDGEEGWACKCVRSFCEAIVGRALQNKNQWYLQTIPGIVETSLPLWIVVTSYEHMDDEFIASNTFLLASETAVQVGC